MVKFFFFFSKKEIKNPSKLAKLSDLVTKYIKERLKMLYNFSPYLKISNLG